MNKGVYREASATPGLPFARTGLHDVTAAIVVAAVCAIVMPFLITLSLHSWKMEHLPRWTWPVSILQVAAPMFLAFLGVQLSCGKRISPLLLFLIASLPMVIALSVGEVLIHRAANELARGYLLAAAGFARTNVATAMMDDVYVGLVACGLAVVAYAGAINAVGTIDLRAVPSSSSVAPLKALGALWVSAAAVIGWFRFRDAHFPGLLPALLIAVLVPFAIRAARRAPILIDWHDREEARRCKTALVVAAACALLAVIALERSIETFCFAYPLSLGGDALEDSAAVTRLAPIAYTLHGVLGGLTFAFTLAPAFRDRRLPSGAIATILVGLALVAGAFDLAHRRMALPNQPMADDSIRMPFVEAGGSFVEFYAGHDGHLVVVPRGGNTGERGACVDGAFSPMLYADRDATFADVHSFLPATPGCLSTVRFLIEGARIPWVEERLGPVAAFLGRTSTVGANLDWHRTTTDETFLDVRLLDGGALEVEGGRVMPPLAVIPDIHGRRSVIRYEVRPKDTVGRAIAVMAAVETAYRDVLRPEANREIHCPECVH